MANKDKDFPFLVFFVAFTLKVRANISEHKSTNAIIITVTFYITLYLFGPFDLFVVVVVTREAQTMALSISI